MKSHLNTFQIFRPKLHQTQTANLFSIFRTTKSCRSNSILFKNNLFFRNTPKYNNLVLSSKHLFHTTRGYFEQNPEGEEVQEVIPPKVMPLEEALQMLSVTENDSFSTVRKAFVHFSTQAKNEKQGEELKEALCDLSLAFETVIKNLREKEPEKPKSTFVSKFKNLGEGNILEELEKKQVEEEKTKEEIDDEYKKEDPVLKSSPVTSPKEEEQLVDKEKRFYRLRAVFSFTLNNFLAIRFPILKAPPIEGYTADEWKIKYPNSTFEEIEDTQLPRSRLPFVWLLLLCIILFYCDQGIIVKEDAEMRIELMHHPTLGVSRYFYQDRL